jgi:predicted enzyme related to lactoylglutathione lyase
MLTTIPYIFLYVADLDTARQFYEQALALPVAETDPTSVKYDCGSLMLALNITPPPKPDKESLIVLEVPDLDEKWRELAARGIESLEPVGDAAKRSRTFTDPDGHYLRIVEAADGATHRPSQAARNVLPVIDVLLSVPDPQAARVHYGQVLGLREVSGPHGDEAISYDVGCFRLSIYPGSAGSLDPDAPAASYVFHTDDCERERTALRNRGLAVGPVQVGDIGVISRFRDPAGHDFYLYEPSREALSWPSGPVYQRIIQAG